MNHPKKLTVEQKIKMIREFKDIGQIELGKVIGVSDSTICRYESDAEEHKHLKYNIDQIMALKEYFGIKHAPILDGEYPIYKTMLYDWLDAINVGRDDEIEELHNKLSDIMMVPWERDLTLLFMIFEAKRHLTKKEFKEAEEKLKLIATQTDATSSEVIYHLNYTLGSLNFWRGKYEEALEFYLSVEDLEIDNFDKRITIFYNVANCYSAMGRYLNAISSLERVRRLHDHRTPNYHWINLSTTLGLSYAQIGHTDKAEKILGKAFSDATILKDEYYIRAILHNFGCTYVKEKEYKKALEYFERAFKYIERGDEHHLENLYYKACCVVVIKRYDMKDVLERGISLSQENESKMYTMLFESLSHLSNLQNIESRNFIEQETIPYLKDERKYFKAMFYCEQLKEYYASKDRKQKVFEVDSRMLEITNKMLK